MKEVCLWGNRKGSVLSYIGKRIERRGLSVKEEERREKEEVGHSKDSGAKRKKSKIREKRERESLSERV